MKTVNYLLDAWGAYSYKQASTSKIRHHTPDTTGCTTPSCLQVWAELEGPKLPTVQQVSAAAARGSTGVETFLTGMDAASRKAGHEQRIARLLDGLPPGVVVFVASQGVNPELPRKLDKQRKACEDRRCASVWNAEQGELLEALENRARDGCVFVTVT